MRAAVHCPSSVHHGHSTAVGAGPLRPAARSPWPVLAACCSLLPALPALAADIAASAHTAMASMAPPAAASEQDRATTAATREFARRLLAQFGLDTQPGGRPWLPASRWSLGVATDGPVRWLAGAYADERSRTWLSTGISWPLAGTVTANLAWSQPIRATRQPRWTLGLSLDF